MRAICRGPWPAGEDDHPLSFDPYTKARIPLIGRIGEYCSYCEREGDLHVKHVIPQTIAPELVTDWSNFLLGCVNCNSTKGNDNRSRSGYLWPDEDDTFNAFTYRSGGRISVTDGLAPDVERRAKATFDLVGLGAKDTDSSRRRHKRRNAWDEAIEVRDLVNGEDTRQLAIKVALRTGFFSVWDGRVSRRRGHVPQAEAGIPGNTVTLGLQLSHLRAFCLCGCGSWNSRSRHIAYSTSVWPNR